MGRWRQSHTRLELRRQKGDRFRGPYRGPRQGEPQREKRKVYKTMISVKNPVKFLIRKLL